MMKRLIFCLILLVPIYSLGKKGYSGDGFTPSDFLSFVKIPDKQTTDGVQATLLSLNLDDPSTNMITTICEARKSDSTIHEGFKKTVLVYRDGASATIAGSVVVDFAQPGVNYSFDYGVSGNNLKLYITGESGHTVDWRCHYTQTTLG